ncbi:MAG: TonB-dependent receptor [Alphaproteobacteria bacterium HGW-Alphaproteobacteria-16]|nr:MAG: TonB-dependent receptor [Alphaproteobacteria bacterium HGW-Alphaproteobacteria-16]
MRLFHCFIAAMLFVGMTIPAPAQEVVVTATRSAQNREGFLGTSIPIITLKRTADFAVQRVAITGDTRDQALRRKEIYAMVKSAIDLAQRNGVELATGDYVVEPLTTGNYGNLTLVTDRRPDSERTSFIIKAKLEPGMDAKAALERISKFIKAVPPTGRAQMETVGDLTLSVLNPDQYRQQIIQMIATDAAATSARFGPEYGVEVRGLDRPVEWSRASLTEVFLYLPAAYVIRPK